MCLRFSEPTKGKVAVLISHRFATVRMADRILVLKGGELVEQGMHEALVERGGLYAELFQLQAAGYLLAINYELWYCKGTRLSQCYYFSLRNRTRYRDRLGPNSIVPLH